MRPTLVPPELSHIFPYSLNLPLTSKIQNLGNLNQPPFFRGMDICRTPRPFQIFFVHPFLTLVQKRAEWKNTNKPKTHSWNWQLTHFSPFTSPFFKSVIKRFPYFKHFKILSPHNVFQWGARRLIETVSEISSVCQKLSNGMRHSQQPKTHILSNQMCQRNGGTPSNLFHTNYDESCPRLLWSLKRYHHWYLG